MEVTQVRIFPVEEEKLKAFVSIVLDDCFVVSDIKIIQGANGLFISMPSKRRRNGTFRDIAHPLNHETRNHVETCIIEKYRAVMIEELGALGDVELRSLDILDDAPVDPELVEIPQSNPGQGPSRNER